MCKLFLAWLSVLGIMYGQSTTGTLVGTVSDATGAVVAGVKIRVTNTGTGLFVDTVTNTSGDYTVANLPAASYKIRADFTGFRSVEVTDLRLLLNQTLRADIRLEAGALEQS